MIKVLFVCLGNICRSPMAEAILKDLVAKRQLSDKIFVDSAGIEQFQVGSNTDPRTLSTLEIHGIMGFNHRARLVNEIDVQAFDYVLVMEKLVYDEVTKLLHGQPKMGLKYMGAFDPMREGDTIKDPYHGTMQDFKAVYARLLRCCESLLNEIELKLN